MPLAAAGSAIVVSWWSRASTPRLSSLRKTCARSRTSSTWSTAGPVTSIAVRYSANPSYWPNESRVGRDSCEVGVPEEVEHVPQRQDAANRRGEGRRRGCGLRLLVADRRVLGDHVAHRPVLLGRVAGLVERGVVVIARDDREVRPLVVGAVGEPEVRAAVEHVDVDRRAALEQLVEAAGGVVDGGQVVMAPPVVEPAVPELRAHQRSGRLVPAQACRAVRAPGSRTIRSGAAPGCRRSRACRRPAGRPWSAAP